MLRDTTDERTIVEFVTDVCASGNWKLTFHVTTEEAVKEDPDAEPDERFTFDGDARDFEEEMRSREDDVIDTILDEPIMMIADDILCDYDENTLDIYIIY